MTDLRAGFAVSFEPSFRASDGSSVWLARIVRAPDKIGKRWPTDRAKPVIVLVADTLSEIVETIAVWLGEGAPSIEEVAS